MNKVDLKEYKAKLEKLSKLEKEQRDIYLKQIADGDIAGPMVGYMTIDKPYLKYIDYEDMFNDPGVKNVYQELYDNNKDNLDQVALMYFGAKITYKQFFENIDKTAKALVANGINKGDFVTISSALNPETLYIFYALAKIGGIANFMSPYFDKDGSMIDRINECNSKVALVMDQFYSELEDTLEKSSIEKTIILPTLNSSPLKFIKKSIKPNRSKNEITWNEFIKEGKNVPTPETVEFEHLMPLAMVFSSGTTGASKAILLTHDSFENSIHAYSRCGVKLNRGDVYYQIIPPWFSTGINTSAHLPLSNGGTLFMDPRFDRKVFVKNNLKLNPAGTIAAISMFQGFLEPELLGKGCLSNLNVTFQGGEKMEMEDKLHIEEVFKQYNSDARLMNGYGQCECGAGITTQTMNTPSNTTVGIPIPGVEIGIFDEDKNEMPYNVRGEILVNTPCGMKEYYKNPEATADYFYYDEFGKKWNCTGDIGFINENGELTVLGRASDFSIINGKKVYNFDIENAIRKVDGIQNCDVFLDNEGKLVAHIILRNKDAVSSYIDLSQIIQSAIYSDLDDIDFVPEFFKFRDNFPAAKSGKRDVPLMKSEVDGFMYSNKYLIDDTKKLVRK